MGVILKRHALTPSQDGIHRGRTGRLTRRRNVARRGDGSISRDLVGSLRDRSVVSLSQQALRAQLSISQASHSLHSSRRAVVAQCTRVPTTRVDRSERLPHQRTFHIRGAPPVYCAVISRHPEAVQVSHLGRPQSPWLKLVRKPQIIAQAIPYLR